jgi:hypothetical protein
MYLLFSGVLLSYWFINDNSLLRWYPLRNERCFPEQLFLMSLREHLCEWSQVSLPCWNLPTCCRPNELYELSYRELLFEWKHLTHCLSKLKDVHCICSVISQLLYMSCGLHLCWGSYYCLYLRRFILSWNHAITDPGLLRILCSPREWAKLLTGNLRCRFVLCWRS